MMTRWLSGWLGAQKLAGSMTCLPPLQLPPQFPIRQIVGASWNLKFRRTRGMQHVCQWLSSKSRLHSRTSARTNNNPRKARWTRPRSSRSRRHQITPWYLRQFRRGPHHPKQLRQWLTIQGLPLQEPHRPPSASARRSFRVPSACRQFRARAWHVPNRERRQSRL